MYSLLISVSKFKHSRFSRLTQQEKSEDINDITNFVSIKWFFSFDYENQESLNDAAEIFADGIAKDTDDGHYVCIHKIEDKGGGNLYEIYKLLKQESLSVFQVENIQI